MAPTGGASPRALASAFAPARASRASRARSAAVSWFGPGASSSGTGDHPVGHLKPRPGQHGGDVGRYRGRDQHLLGPTDQAGQPLAATAVQFGENVIEN